MAFRRYYNYPKKMSINYRSIVYKDNNKLTISQLYFKILIFIQKKFSQQYLKKKRKEKTGNSL